MKRFTKILLWAMLLAVMTLGVVCTARADASKTISGLGTTGIENPTSGSGGWSKVYFGKYGTTPTPILFNVLKNEETNFTWSSGAVKLYYTATAANGANGTVTFTLPENYERNKENWKVWLLAEQVNEGNATDYASAPVEIDLSSALVEVSTWSQLYDALQTGGNIKLTGDVTYGTGGGTHASAAPLAVPEGKSVTLDLNGHVIDRGLSSGPASDGYVIEVYKGSLTLTDGNPTAAHGGTLPAGGIITGGNGDNFNSNCGGVCVRTDGKLIMNGGTIFGNRSALSAGGVYVSGGTFTMNGGTISGNSTSSKGGGVYVEYGSKTYTMNGGTITGNSASDKGGGVYVNEGQFNISGNPVITGNTKGSVANNVFLYGDYITINVGTLTSGASIGVMRQPAGVFTTGASFASDTAAQAVFCADNSAAYAVKASSGEAMLSPYPATAPTITTQPAATTTLASGYTSGGTLTVAASAATDTAYALAYQWYSNTTAGNTGGTLIDGATGSSFDIPTELTAGSHYYYCVVTATRTDNSQTAAATSSVATVTVKAKETTPNAEFKATGVDSGELSELVASAAYTISGAGLSSTAIIAGTDGTYKIASGLTAGTLSIVKTGNGTTTVDSEAKEISVTKVEKPAEPAACGCTTRENNDGKITDDTAEMEYRKSDATVWTVGTGDDITGLVPGTYYVRMKAHDAVLASDNQELTISEFIPATVAITATNKNVSWSADGIAIPVDGMFSIPTGAGEPAYSVTNGTREGSYANGKLTVTKCGTFTVTVNTAETATHEAGTASAILTVSQPYIVRIEGTVKLFDRTFTADDVFSVTITAPDSTPMPAQTSMQVNLQPGTNTADFSFDEIEFTHVSFDGVVPDADGSRTKTFTYTVTANTSVEDINNYGDLVRAVTVTAKDDGDGMISAKITYDDGAGMIFLSTHKIIGNITWVDGGRSHDNAREITLELKRKSSKTGSVEVLSNAVPTWNGNTYTYSNLEIYEEKVYEYTYDVSETAIPSGYSSSKNGYDFTNTGNAVSCTVSFKVINGSWDDETTADKTVTLTGYEGDTLRLAADKIPAVGNKPKDNTYKAGRWDVTPSTETAITTATTYTYTYAKKETPGNTAPTANVLTWTGQPQPLLKPGSVKGGTLYYAIGTNDTIPPEDGWSEDIPTGTNEGNYYVWYKVTGDMNHNDVPPVCIVVTITEAAKPEPPAPTSSTSDYTVLASLKTSGKKALKMSWTAVSDAQGYDIFFGQCSKGDSQYLASVNGTSYKIKGLKKGVAYKAYVRAWKTVGGAKEYIGEASPDMHAITGGKSNHYTNPKKISVKKKKLTLAVGQSKSIKAKLKKYNSSRSYLNHVAKVRYYSSDCSVATVNAKGSVTGVGPGKCTVYAVAENGLRVGVKVTVE